jgi:hypothetical protein
MRRCVIDRVFFGSREQGVAVGIRETLNKNPAIVTGLTVGVILIGVILIVWQLVRGGGNEVPVAQKLFFTDDDGKTTFEDIAWRVPPFQRNGKEAVRAHVFRCPPNGTPFVAWLEKYEKASKEKMDKFFEDPKHQGKFSLELFDDAVRMLKRPGDAQWRKWTIPNLDAVRTRRCPDGQLAEEIAPSQK